MYTFYYYVQVHVPVVTGLLLINVLITGVMRLRLASLVMLNLDWTCVTELSSLQYLRENGEALRMLFHIFPVSWFLIPFLFYLPYQITCNPLDIPPNCQAISSPPVFSVFVIIHVYIHVHQCTCEMCTLYITCTCTCI